MYVWLVVVRQMIDIFNIVDFLMIAECILRKKIVGMH